MMTSTETFRSLVQPGRVHRRLYTDPAIFEAEMERIFGSAWIYVGHETQVGKPGDYVRTLIGRKPVVLVRDADGEVRVIHNQETRWVCSVIGRSLRSQVCSAAAI